MPYQRPTLNAPRLAGAAIRLVAPLADSAVLGGIIRGQMLGQVGLDALRQARLDTPPSLGPDFPRPATPTPVGTPDVSALGNVPEEQGRGFRFVSAAQLHQAYRAGRVNPSEVAQRVVKAVEASENTTPPLRAIIAQKSDDVMKQAEASSARWREGKPLSPLDGVPVAVKDELYQEGYPTTVGTRFLGLRPSGPEATVVSRLRAAGAVLIGKTNMHELGMGVTGMNPHHGPARNPYDPARFTGGSSSGTAASVAAGMVPLAVGADGGGSIRIPSSLCGVVGLKATFGRVSEFGAAPLCWSVGHVGPLGATALDVALGYALMAGPDPKDPGSQHQPPVVLGDLLDGDLSDVKLGICWPWFEDADPDVVAACRRTVEALKVLGATVVEVEMPDLNLVRLAHLVTIASEMGNARAAHFDAEMDQYGADVRLNMAMVQELTSVDYVQAQRVRTMASRAVTALFKDVDVLVTPSTACTAQVIGQDAVTTGESNLGLMDRIMRYALLANLTGIPAISFPAGYDGAGMPVGLQLMGRPWEEPLLLRIAVAAERMVERQAPKVHTPLLRENEKSAG
jgi:Asp-tRNA(Asn)/Glu-tRNA(Gln) amidotransferase A subunit family amidase